MYLQHLAIRTTCNDNHMLETKPWDEAPWDVGCDEKVLLNVERNVNVQVSHLLPHADMVICVASCQQ